jgi:hypothetical protein
VKEIATYGGDVKDMIPGPALTALHEAQRREF